MNEPPRAFNQELLTSTPPPSVFPACRRDYVIDHMMPVELIAAKLERSLAQALSRVERSTRSRERRGLRGPPAPNTCFTGARFYDVGDGAMAFDVDAPWVSDITADMDVVPLLGLPRRGLRGFPFSSAT